MLKPIVWWTAYYIHLCRNVWRPLVHICSTCNFLLLPTSLHCVYPLFSCTLILAINPTPAGEILPLPWSPLLSFPVMLIYSNGVSCSAAFSAIFDHSAIENCGKSNVRHERPVKYSR